MQPVAAPGSQGSLADCRRRRLVRSKGLVPRIPASSAPWSLGIDGAHGSNAPGAPSFLGGSSAWGPSPMGCLGIQHPRDPSRRAATRRPGSKVVRSPRDRRGIRTLLSWCGSRLDIKLLLPPRRRRDHGTWVLPVHRWPVFQVLNGTLVPRRPGRPWDRAILLTMGTWHLLKLQRLGTEVSRSARCLEHLEKPASSASCRMRHVGAMGPWDPG